MTATRIIIPHGLAADVLRVLQGTRRGTCGNISTGRHPLRILAKSVRSA